MHMATQEYFKSEVYLVVQCYRCAHKGTSSDPLPQFQAPGAWPVLCVSAGHCVQLASALGDRYVRRRNAENEQ